MLRKILITLLLFCFYVSQAWGVILIQTGDTNTLIFSCTFEDTTEREKMNCQTGTCDFATLEASDCDSGDCEMVGTYVAALSTSSIMVTDAFSGGGVSELYLVFSYRLKDAIPSGNSSFFLAKEGASGKWRGYTYTDADVYIQYGNFNAFYAYSAGDRGTNDTTFWLQVHWKAGTTVTAVLETKWYVVGTGWDASWVSTTASSDITYDIDRIMFENGRTDTGQEFYFDHIFVYSQEITVDPRTLPL